MHTKSMLQLACILPFAAALLAASPNVGAQGPGSIDTSFGNGGTVQTNVLGEVDRAFGMAQQSDGKLVVVGQGRPGPTWTDFAIVRYQANGTLDQTFGSGGVVGVNLGFNDEAHAVAIQSDGKIVVAGLARETTSSNSRRFAVVRLMPDGQLDPSFAKGGALVVNRPSLFAIALQPDGKILVGGGQPTLSSSDFFIARLTADGAFDQSFGEAGMVYLPFADNGEDVVYELIALPDGRILAVGQARGPGEPLAFGLARLTATGQLDPAFHGGGKFTFRFNDVGGLTAGAFAAKLDSQNRIVAAGYAQPASNYWNFALARFNFDGQIDPSFGDQGKVLTQFPGIPGSAWAFDVAIQSNGKIVAAGRRNVNTQYDFALARYLADGSLDSSFGNGGLVSTTIVGTEEARAVVITPTGRIVAAGWGESGSNLGDFALAAYHGDPVQPPVTGDITGDGVVNVNDLLAVINAWGPCPAPPQSCPADIAPAPNGDGVVNVNDLLMVINNWG